MAGPVETFLVMSRKTDAARVCRRLRDHCIIAGVRGKRGEHEVYGFVPPKKTYDSVRALALKVYRER